MTEYLIIGNGIAGTTAADYIRQNDSSGNITLVGEEDIPLYSRIRLNQYISGYIDESDLIIKKEKWYIEKNIKSLTNTKIIDAAPDKKVVFTEKGEKLYYDRLLIATGSHSFVPPITGADQKYVFTLRNVKNARNISTFVKNVENIVVIGGGLLGIETGSALVKAGKKVTIFDHSLRLLNRQLDNQGAKKFQTIMEKMGLCFMINAQTSAITDQNRVELKTGESLPADMVIISAGVRPNLDIAGPLGLEIGRGIKINEKMQTNNPDIFAAGDIAEFQGCMYGIWPASTDQGRIAGVNMAGGNITYQGTTMSNTLKVAGIVLASAGNIDVENKFENQIVSNENVYKKLVIDNNTIIGCIMLGNKKGFNKIFKAMVAKKDISDVRNSILEDGFDFKLL